MIFNVYDKLKEDRTINKVIGSDYMILEYKCPIDVEKFQVLLDMHFITYVISGKKDWIVSDKTFEVNEGDAIFLRKGVYTTKQYFDVDHCILTFFLNDEFICNFLRENKNIGLTQTTAPVTDQAFPLDVDESLKALFYSIYNYLQMGREVPQNLVEIKFKELLFNLILNPRHKKLAQFFATLNQTSKTGLHDIMMKNFQYDLPLDEFARLCGRSLSAFKRDFKTTYRQTPGKWINDKRLEYASTLLVSSDLNVNEICFESGFRNCSHFNKAFKDKYQITPKQFRMARKDVDVVTG
ncbi:AraC family transcriptional regulator [Chryseolinea sp. H1M3-3]|uniref:helix-turn-helix domain-containing protein n=1 Tax=Chryseolinea sp. H1M3-3 TaxID=3034144 RepID=UPI0023EE0EBB|nr:AraC family transcriptional regulator [Chryseolinea sp. H1M3-3]